MSNYLTKQDLLDELGEDELAKLTAVVDGDPVDDTRVQTVIDNATGVFEGYVRDRYSLPVSTTPLVKQIVKSLAIYELYKRWSTDGEGKGRFGVISKERNEALVMCRDIAHRRMALDVPAAEETKTSPQTADNVLTNASKSVFTDEKLSSF